MSRTPAALMCLLTTLVSVSVADAWKTKKGNLLCQCISRPSFNTVSRSPTNCPFFLSAQPFLTVYPIIDEAPLKPFIDAIYIPDPISITEKSSVILHKIHKIYEDLVEDEALDNEEKVENIIRPEAFQEDSYEYEDNYNVTDDREDIEISNDEDDDEDDEEASSEEIRDDEIKDEETEGEKSEEEESKEEITEKEINEKESYIISCQDDIDNIYYQLNITVEN